MSNPLHLLPWKKRNIATVIMENEKVIDSFGTHWIKYVTPASIFIVLLITCIGLLIISKPADISSFNISSVLYLIGVILLSIVHHWFFHKILSEGMVDAVITNKRFIYMEDSLWLNDLTHEVTLDRVRAIEVHQKGVLQNIFNYGTLWFDTGGSDISSGKIHLVPGPHTKARMINSLMTQQT